MDIECQAFYIHSRGFDISNGTYGIKNLLVSEQSTTFDIKSSTFYIEGRTVGIDY